MPDIQRAVADEGERQIRVEDCGVVAKQSRQAAHRGQRAERHDERRQTKERDQHAVAEPDHKPGQQSRDDAEIAERLRDQQADDGRGCEDGTDRKIDAAGQDHERHPGAEHCVDRRLLSDDREVLPGQEPALAGEIDPGGLDQQAQNDEHRQHADRCGRSWRIWRLSSALARAGYPWFAERVSLTCCQPSRYRPVPVASHDAFLGDGDAAWRRPTSPASRPSASPRRGRQMPTTSGSSELMTSTAAPTLGEFVDDRVDLRLGADIDAPGRLVEDQHLRRLSRSRDNSTFCWLPPDKRSGREFPARDPDIQRLDRGQRADPGAGAIDEPPRLGISGR